MKFVQHISIYVRWLW